VSEEFLYHYTTPEGLVGIVEKQEIWATDLSCMNDTTEFRVGLDLAIKHLEELHGDGSCAYAERWKWLLTALRGRRDHGTETLSSVYACCFSDDGDDLSQWRAYCPNGGFAIGFPRTALGTIAHRQKWLALDRCIYDEGEQETAIKKTVEDTLHAMVEPESSTASAAASNEQQENLTRWFLLWRLIRKAAVCKDAAFREEDEWRLVAMCTSYPEEADIVRFRCRTGLVVPYWPIALDRGRWGQWDSITVVVGPTPHPDESLASIRRFLCACCHNCMIDVRQSKVPYRYW
jgi:hypothetical protein